MFRLPNQSYPVGLDIGHDLTFASELHLGALFVNDNVILARSERYTPWIVAALLSLISAAWSLAQAGAVSA